MTNYSPGTRLSLWTSDDKFVGIFTVSEPRDGLQMYSLVLEGSNDRYTREGLRQCLANRELFHISTIITDTVGADYDPSSYMIKGLEVTNGRTVIDNLFGPEPSHADEYLLHILLSEVKV
ncbi:MAG: hypothetical protein ACXABD_19410 [Candidatus Thorarchaeota archaeon]|jgi:hypothetical protein